MDINVKRPAVEIAADWIAAICLGAAVAFAALRLVPLGLVQASGIGIAAAATALLLTSKVGPGAAFAAPSFAPVEWPGEEEEALLLDEEVEEETLLLDGAVLADRDSPRVVRLFDTAPIAAAKADAILPPPGEMLARIEDFLDAARGSAARGSAGGAEPALPANVASDEASAALHAALADIRRSLRRG